MFLITELLDESYLQIKFEDYNFRAFQKALALFLNIHDFSGFGVNYIDSDGHYMWLPHEGTFKDVDFYKNLSFIVLFLRIRFFSSNILSIESPVTVFQYFLYGVSSLKKLELPKHTYEYLVTMKEYVLTGNSDCLKEWNQNEDGSLQDSRGAYMLKFLNFLAELPCYNGHFYEFENVEKSKLFLIVILPKGLRRYQVNGTNQEINEEPLIPWEEMKTVFVEDNYLTIEHAVRHSGKLQNENKNGRQPMTTSWSCPSYWHAMNLCAEVIHQRTWHLEKMQQSSVRPEEGLSINESDYNNSLTAIQLNNWLDYNYPPNVKEAATDCLKHEDKEEVTDPWSPQVNVELQQDRLSERRRRRRNLRQRHTTVIQLERTAGTLLPKSHPHWSPTDIVGQFNHLVGEYAKNISEIIESWQLADRHRLIDTSLSVSQLNSFAHVDHVLTVTDPVESQTQEWQTDATEETHPERLSSHPHDPGCNHQQQEDETDLEELSKKITKIGSLAHWDSIESLVLHTLELKRMINDKSRRLAELCQEEMKMTGRLPNQCLSNCSFCCLQTSMNLPRSQPVVYRPPPPAYSNGNSGYKENSPQSVPVNFTEPSQSPYSESWTLSHVPLLRWCGSEQTSDTLNSVDSLNRPMFRIGVSNKFNKPECTLVPSRPVIYLPQTCNAFPRQDNAISWSPATVNTERQQSEPPSASSFAGNEYSGSLSFGHGVGSLTNRLSHKQQRNRRHYGYEMGDEVSPSLVRNFARSGNQRNTPDRHETPTNSVDCPSSSFHIGYPAGQRTGSGVGNHAVEGQRVSDNYKTPDEIVIRQPASRLFYPQGKWDENTTSKYCSNEKIVTRFGGGPARMVDCSTINKASLCQQQVPPDIPERSMSVSYSIDKSQPSNQHKEIPMPFFQRHRRAKSPFYSAGRMPHPGKPLLVASSNNHTLIPDVTKDHRF